MGYTTSFRKSVDDKLIIPTIDLSQNRDLYRYPIVRLSRDLYL